ncbi:phosphatidylserine decarboxylase [Woeseia oceani]|uniref:Phosphatidylserine decarboxylase n=1 Tax=Woeseia oceani TaxID=1548547 RepID=A0A193LGT3_9GAMM|nr:phosphatidylserine decarboxylase [Woeseia oceani]ANO51671.1 hypothetical protein BA177_11055 [Woeseia oceani]
MKGRRNPFVAREGLPYLLASLALLAVAWNLGGWHYALPIALFSVWLYCIFRDPRRPVPPAPLGVVSPVDGKVLEIGTVDCGTEHGDVQRILIKVDSFGPYTARCPAEGTVMDLSCELPDGQPEISGSGLWMRTDEGADVLLQFHGHRFGLAPRAFARYGERIGQGQRCAYLRLTRFAEVRVPRDSRVLVEAGQRVRAGADLIARLAQ